LGLIWSAFIVFARGWIAGAFHVPPGLEPEASSALLVFALGTLLIFPAQVLLATLQGFERLDLSNICVVLGVLAQSVALVFGVSRGGGVEAAAWAGVLGQVVSGTLAAILFRRELRSVNPSGSGTTPALGDVIRLGGALQLLGILNALQFQSGRIVLGLLGNLTMVTQYELAFRVGFAVYSIPILIQGAIIPTVSRTEQSQEPAAVESLFTSATRWIYIKSVIALGLLWLLAPDLTRVWLGPGNETIARLIRLWALALSVSLAYSPGVAIARGLGRPWFEIISYGAALLTHVGLAIVLVPRYGPAGAIEAAGISFVVGFLVFVPLFHRHCHIPFRPWFRRELLPRLAAGVLTVTLGAGLLGLGRLAPHLPAQGWGHGVLATLLFITIFALLFVPLGDTQRLSQTLWQMRAGVLPRRRG
jgi:O-antigen/teichoic acid export membrane protein